MKSGSIVNRSRVFCGLSVKVYNCFSEKRGRARSYFNFSGEIVGLCAFLVVAKYFKRRYNIGIIL